MSSVESEFRNAAERYQQQRCLRFECKIVLPEANMMDDSVADELEQAIETFRAYGSFAIEGTDVVGAGHDDFIQLGE